MFNLNMNRSSCASGNSILILPARSVLRCQNQKRIGEGISLFADGDLPFLYRFEQGALNFCRRTIDLVGQDQVPKNWSELGRIHRCGDYK